MLEILIVSMCFYGRECDQMVKAYRAQYPWVRQYERGAAKVIEKEIGKETSVIIGTLAAGATNKKIRLRIVRGLVFNGNKDEQSLTFRWDF